MTTLFAALAIVGCIAYIYLTLKNLESTYYLRIAVICAIGLCTVLMATSANASEYYYLPNSTLTPGDVASVNKEEVCNPAYPAKARDVSNSKKNAVYKRYGVTKDKCTKGCKIDHLIPLAIGGSNDLKNLWPHEYGADWTVYEKTRLEVRLRKAVCKENMPIEKAQQCIASNWTTCYEGFYPGQHAQRVAK